MNDFHRMLQVLKNNPNKKFAMATIIEVIGSNYRRVGAKMLFSETNDMFGTISAGCLEEDIAHHAQVVIETQKPHIATYDLMSDDLVLWGENIGCNGKITVYIEPMDWQQIAQLESILLDGVTLISFKCTNGILAGTKIYMIEETSPTDLAQLQFDSDPLQTLIRDFLDSDHKAHLVFCETTNGQYFFERYHPCEKLYVFGAGPDAEPIASLAAQMDFDVTVIDPRENRCNSTYFPLANQLEPSHPTTYLQNHHLPANSYVLVMTHNFKWDREIVEHLIKHPVLYLGVLGPRRRTQALLQGRNLPDWVHSPVGLSIGAEGPYEISISILAQLIQIRSQLGMIAKKDHLLKLR